MLADIFAQACKQSIRSHSSDFHLVEVMQSQMNLSSSNMFNNTTMMLAEDCNIVDSSQHQQMLLNEDTFLSNSTGTLTDFCNGMQNMADLQQLLFNDNMIPSHSTGALADHGNVMQTMDGLEQLNCERAEELHPTIQTFDKFSTFDQSGDQSGETKDFGNDMPNIAYLEQLLFNDDMILSHYVGTLANHGNDMQNIADLEQQSCELAQELHPTIQTVPAFPTFDQSGDQSGETEDFGNDMPNIAYLEQLLLNDDMILSHSVDTLANYGNDMQNVVDLEQQNCELAEELHPTIQTMQEISTFDQSGETEDLEEDGEDDQEDPEEDGEFSEDCVDGPTTVLTPRPVLPPGKTIGVSFHKKNKQWEAHLWVRGPQLRGRKKKGVQVFLGNFDTVDKAKQAHDKAAIKLEVRTTARGKPYPLNFPEADYAGYIAEHSNWTPRDFLWKIRRLSNKFSKGKSSLKGVTVRKRAAKRGQPPVVFYESKVSQTAKESGDDMKRTFMLGNFASEEEAGKAYDRALLFLHQHLPEVEQLRCITNFRPSSYSVTEIEAMRSKLAR